MKTANKVNTALFIAIISYGMVKAGVESCSSGACTSTAKSVAKNDQNLTTLQMKAYVDSGEAILLDARSGKYDDGNRIPGAKSLNAKSSVEEVEALIPTKDAFVITYCSNLKCPASKALFDHLKKLGYTNVWEYPEGIDGWITAGGEVEKTK